MKPKMWAYLIHFGHNMWYKKGLEVPWLGELDDEQPIYRDYLYFDRDTWNKVTEFMPTRGINTLLIDMGEAVRLIATPSLLLRVAGARRSFVRS